jgi:RHS repeat-associated protein
MSLSRLCAPAILFASFSFVAHAQDLPDVAQGLQPYGAYHGGGLDAVSMSNGGLTVRIPLLSYPQKGALSLSYSVIFNSFGYQDQRECDTSYVNNGGDPNAPGDPIIVGGSDLCQDQVSPILTGSPAMPLPLSGPRVVMDQLLQAAGSSALEEVQSPTPPKDVRFFIIEPDFSQHILAPMSDGIYRSMDESGYAFSLTDPVSQFALTPSYSQPTPITSAHGPITDSKGVVHTPSGMTDLDGNTITIDSAQTVHDSAGRLIPPVGNGGAGAGCPTWPGANSPSGGSGSLWTVPGPGGLVSYLFCYTTVNIHTHLGYSPSPSTTTEFIRPEWMLQAIVLPNGTYWGFQYDSYDPSNPTTTGLGQLTKLIYPTGGSVTYTYGLVNGLCDTALRGGLAPNGVSIMTWIPTVATRTMNDASGNSLGQWTYAVSNVPYGRVISPTGELTVARLISDYSGCGAIDGGSDVYQGSTTSTTLLKSTRKIYDGTLAPGYPQTLPNIVVEEDTSFANGSTSKVKYQHSAPQLFYSMACTTTGAETCSATRPASLPLGGPTVATYQDYNGSVLKTESTTYLWQYDTTNAYFANNLITLPSQTQILDSFGNTVSSTSYAYDEATYSSANAHAGHATTVTQALYTSGTSPVTHTGWNASGMKTYMLDPDANAGIPGHTNTSGHTFDYNYGTGSCSGSLVTDTYNALNQHVSGTYDCNTGRLATYTDANSNTTSVSYDAMGRLSNVIYPAVPIQGGQMANPVTSFNYNDSANTVTETVLATPDPTQTTTAIFDSFGREIHRSKSGTPNSTTVDTTYDADGRVSTVSNPYYSTGDATYGITTYTYDALSRKVSQLQPDGNSSLTWSYSGPTVDSFDEAGVHMQHTSDALGRLVQVSELGTSSSPLSLSTSYVYDPLGNLRNVAQSGGTGDTPRNRSFVYDSLSRLTSSTNPETGTIGYTYDANSNLLTKTDARGITVTYSGYDGLNRPHYKNYSDGTLPVAYGYDGNIENGTPLSTFGLTSANSIGRLSIVSNDYNAATTYSYDAMGRVALQGTFLPSVNAWGLTTSASYDLAGNMTGLTYPDGHHIMQAFDSAGRLSSSNLVDINGVSSTASYLQGVTYLPDGSPGVLTLGNGVQQSIAKNNRLQVQSLAVTDPLTSATYISRDYCYVNCATGGSANNGNIWGITDTQNSTRTQGFTYDPLNRIGSFSLGGALNQQFQVDSFGNMSLMSGGNPVSTFDAATNRISNLPCAASVAGYDAAGNQLCSTDQYGGIVQYSFDAESRISAITAQGSGTPFVNYIYGADGARVRKSNADGTFTEYVDFGGQPIAEKDQTGAWTDYIYADGKKIARVSSADYQFKISATLTSNVGGHGRFDLAIPQNPGGGNYTVQAGDQMCWRQNSPNVDSGVAVWFDNGLDSIMQNWIASDGYQMWARFPGGGMVNRCVDLTGGGTDNNAHIVYLALLGYDWTASPTSWNAYFADMAIYSANGQVTPIITQQSPAAAAATSSFGDGTSILSSQLQAIPAASNATHFYLGDHLGTAQMEFSSGGWPVWQGQFAPYGQELDTQTTQNHYKFTGKERDAESGLDYFGARYYSSNMGRWMSPDWADKPEAVPYSDLHDPQSLNLYGYVRNNPLSRADADGHDCCTLPTLPTMEEVNAVAGPLVASAAGALTTAAEVTVSTALAPVVAIGALIASPQAAGNWNDDHPTAQTRDGRPPSETNPVITSSTVGQSGLPKPGAGKGSVPPDQRDPKRVSTSSEKDKQLAKQGGKCANCGEPVKPGEGIGHHVERHADGGKTDSANVPVVCKDCHKDLHSPN